LLAIADNGQQALDLLDRGIRPRLILVELTLPRHRVGIPHVPAR
jgi:hypothetical protein